MTPVGGEVGWFTASPCMAANDPPIFHRTENHGDCPFPAPMTDVTQMLRRWREGDPEAMDRVLPVVYGELRQLARARLRGERAGHTLGTTGLVHEAYLRLVDVERVEWQDRAHFLAMASRTMRRVLIDYANQRNAAKRGGARHQLSLDEKIAAPRRELDAFARDRRHRRGLVRCSRHDRA